MDWIKLAIIEFSGGSCEQGNRPSSYITGKDCIDLLSNYLVFKNDCAPWSLFSLSFSLVSCFINQLIEIVSCLFN